MVEDTGFVELVDMFLKLYIVIVLTKGKGNTMHYREKFIVFIVFIVFSVVFVILSIIAYMFIWNSDLPLWAKVWLSN